MTFRKRLAVIEKSVHRLDYVPPIVIHTIVKPGEYGPKEMEAFAQMQTNAVCHTIERKPMKLRSILKSHSLLIQFQKNILLKS